MRERTVLKANMCGYIQGQVRGMQVRIDHLNAQECIGYEAPKKWIRVCHSYATTVLMVNSKEFILQ